MNLRSRKRESLDVNLTPLIDVVFLLLIFFMVSTTFDKKSELQIQLPEAESGEQAPQKRKSIDVTVDQKGNFYVNQEELLRSDRDTLRRMLDKLAAGNKELPVVISADGDAPHRAVITVMDVAAKLGLNRITFETKLATE